MKRRIVRILAVLMLALYLLCTACAERGRQYPRRRALASSLPSYAMCCTSL